MKPSKVLILDANAIAYAAHYGIGGLGTASGPTGIIFGFFNQVQSICRILKSTHIVFCWDSKKSMRKKVYPGYKERSKQKADPLLIKNLGQFTRLRNEIIPRLEFANSFQQVGYEADDLIAKICQEPGPSDSQEFVIVSSDSDLYQLLNEQVSMYKINRRQLYTARDFQKEFGLTPKHWNMVKAISGCSSDTVPGIRGVGVKTACKYISDGFVPHKKIDTMAGADTIKFNLPLVSLPYPGTKSIQLNWTPASYSAWLEVCEELEFNSFLRTPKIWEQIWTGIGISTGLEKIMIGKR